MGTQVQALLAEVNALAGELRKPMAVAAGEVRVPAGERSILQALGEHGPQTVPGIARARGCSRQSVQILVNRLESQGWVELMSNPAHQRSRLVCLTARGQDLLADVVEQEAVAWEPAVSSISGAGVQRACAVLRRIRHALSGNASTLKPTVSNGGRVRAMAVGQGPRTALARTEGAAVPAASAPEPEEFPVSLL